MNMIDLFGKVVVVIGVVVGLGWVEVFGLVWLGVIVVVNDVVFVLDVFDVVDEIGVVVVDVGVKVVVVVGDISQCVMVDELFVSVVGLGGLDIVVNNVGIICDWMLFNMFDEEWDVVIVVYLCGYFLFICNVVVYWWDKVKDVEGGLVFGWFVNILLEVGLVGLVGQVNYVVVKVGIIVLILLVVWVFGCYGVCVNVICLWVCIVMMVDVFGVVFDVEVGQIDLLLLQYVVSLVQFLVFLVVVEVNGQVFIVYGLQVMLVLLLYMECWFSVDGMFWDFIEFIVMLWDYFVGWDLEQSFLVIDLMCQ